MAIEVIGAGFGRTGTSSLKVALERLGFGPCDHMGEVFKYPARARLWAAAAAAKARSEAIDWAPLHAGYRSTADWPGAYFWRELVDAYPDARVVLSVRDPERWYDSMRKTIWAILHDEEARNRMAASVGISADVGWMPDLVNTLVFDGTFGGRFDDRRRAIRIFEEHAAAVEAALPPDRLLVFEATQGWAPLCRFLGVPVPDEAFPHLNDAASVETRLRRGAGGERPADDEFMRRMAAG